MSLFIGGLTSEHTGGEPAYYLTTYRLGILSGSIISGVIGYLILSFTGNNSASDQTGPDTRQE